MSIEKYVAFFVLIFTILLPLGTKAFEWTEVPLSDINDDDFIGEYGRAFGTRLVGFQVSLRIKKKDDKFIITDSYNYYDDMVCTKDMARLIQYSEKKYVSLYLNCQPIDETATFKNQYVQLKKTEVGITMSSHVFGKDAYHKYDCLNNDSDVNFYDKNNFENHNFLENEKNCAYIGNLLYNSNEGEDSPFHYLYEP